MGMLRLFVGCGRRRGRRGGTRMRMRGLECLDGEVEISARGRGMAYA